MRRFLVLVMVLAAAAACESTKSQLDQAAPPPVASTTEATSTSSAGSASTAPAAPAAPDVDLDSKDILARTETAPDVYVKHVLIGWKEIAHDPRAENRSNADAAKLAQDIESQLKANPDKIDELARKYSEDPGSAKSGQPYHVKADTPFVPEFKNLALRLKEKEVGIVKTQFGYHVIERVSKPPPDPMESSAILARQPEAGPVYALYLVVSWKDAPEPPPGVTRTKAEADKLAKDTVDKANAGQDFQKLITSTTDLPGPKDKPEEPLEVETASRMPDELKDLPLRLKVGEAGMVKTQFGWLVMKRVAPPSPAAKTPPSPAPKAPASPASKAPAKPGH